MICTLFVTFDLFTVNRVPASILTEISKPDLQVVVSGQLDYSDPEVQRDMEGLVQALENTTYIDPAYTESWLRSFMDYVTRWSDYPGGPELRVDSEQNFITTLKDVSRALCSFMIHILTAGCYLHSNSY